MVDWPGIVEAFIITGPLFVYKIIVKKRHLHHADNASFTECVLLRKIKKSDEYLP